MLDRNSFIIIEFYGHKTKYFLLFFLSAIYWMQRSTRSFEICITKNFSIQHIFLKIFSACCYMVFAFYMLLLLLLHLNSVQMWCVRWNFRSYIAIDSCRYQMYVSNVYCIPSVYNCAISCLLISSASTWHRRKSKQKKYAAKRLLAL